MTGCIADKTIVKGVKSDILIRVDDSRHNFLFHFLNVFD